MGAICLYPKATSVAFFLGIARCHTLGLNMPFLQAS